MDNKKIIRPKLSEERKQRKKEYDVAYLKRRYNNDPVFREDRKARRRTYANKKKENKDE